MEYFAQVKTVQGATKRYRALAKKWHPDRNGSIDAGAVMAEINRQYKQLLISFESEKLCRAVTETEEQELEKHTSGHNVHSDPVDRYKEQHWESHRGGRSRARAMFRAFVTDRDIERLGEVVVGIAFHAAESVVSKGVSAVKSWKESL